MIIIIGGMYFDANCLRYWLAYLRCGFAFLGLRNCFWNLLHYLQFQLFPNLLCWCWFLEMELEPGWFHYSSRLVYFLRCPMHFQELSSESSSEKSFESCD